MDANSAFKQVLDSDENVIEVFKPNKLRTIVIGFIKDVLVSLIGIAIGIGLLIAHFKGVKMDDGTPMSAIPGIIFLGISALGVVCSIVSRLVRYSKTWYCYTNKRVIMRTGFIGADYKMLDYSGIAAIDVRVDFLDKLVKPNTGHIVFGSASAPMMSIQTNTTRGGHFSGYVFFGIDNPYDVYKRIKEYIASTKLSNTIK